MLPTTQKNQAEGSKKNMGGTTVQSPTQTEDERQAGPRLTILRGIPLKAEVESMNRTLRDCRCINIGTLGALLDLGEATCPELSVESKLFVIIQLAGETVKLPGIVRHRK